MRGFEFGFAYLVTCFRLKCFLYVFSILIYKVLPGADFREGHVQ